ncbi:cdc42-interacting protein 4 isoform X1 [Protopterus annectens]|uniref:cdc42-interacting protein 4 isoform X1 n=1 Tax=Protopterus annectens TaxID=7888 RepID=UPI001CFB55E9|nr:cdc42-interacting protein 4 isoform X1 [Protopterus annectens]
MDWGTDLWDQYDNIERHTQWGIDLVEKYVKFVKERTEIEQTYAKQLRNLVKKYSPKRISREDPEMKFSQYQSFLSILKELNDFAGQREVIAENMTMNICADIIKYSQEIKQERKVYLLEGRRAQQNLETSFKHLENSKRKFERDCREAEKAALHADKTDQDINATKADVEKAKQQANLRNHMAEESKNDYASQLQKYNHDQSQFYYTDMPQIFNKMQEMDERRIKRLKQGYSSFAEMERQVMPIIGKCLDGMTKAAESVNEKYDSQLVIDLHKSGFPRPGDVEFEDYSQVINRASSDSSLGTPKPAGDVRSVGKNKGKRWLFSKRYKLPPPPFSSLNSHPSFAANGTLSPSFSRDPLSYCLSEISKTVKPRIPSFRTLKRGATVSEDFSHLPPEQRRKKLQQKLDECHKDLQKEFDQRDALHKMKDVYQKNPQMGDPNSLDRGIAENKQNVDRLQTEIQKYEMWLADAEGRLANKGDTIRYSGHLEHSVTLNNNGPHEKESPDTTHSDDSGQEAITQPVYTEFEEEFPEEDEEETVSPIGECIALYPFEGSSEGTMSMTEGEKLDVVEEDKGDGWTRVRRSKGEEGYVPTTYIKITLDRH